MSEKRKIEDKELKDIAGAGEVVFGENPPVKPVEVPPDGGGAKPPATDDQGAEEQEFGE